MPHRQRGHLFRETLKNGTLSDWKIMFRNQAGKTVKLTVGPNKHEAMAVLRQKLDAVYAGTYAGEIRPITVRDRAQAWIIARKGTVKPSTLAGDESALGVYATPRDPEDAIGRRQRGRGAHSFVAVFGNRQLSTLTVSDVNGWLAAASDLKPKTLRNRLTLLVTFLDDAVEDHLLPRNPLKGSRMLYRPRAMREGDELVVEIPTPDEVNRLLDAAPEEGRAFLSVLAMAGLRLGEALALQWGDLEPAASRLYVRRTVYKGAFYVPKSRRSRRTVDLVPQLAALLAARRRSRYGETAPLAEGLVFPSAAGGPLDGDNVRHRWWATALARAGLRAMRMHDLRHFFASVLIAQGESVKYVSAQLGHASAAVTLDRYSHLWPEHRREALGRSEETWAEILRGSGAVADGPVTSLTE